MHLDWSCNAFKLCSKRFIISILIFAHHSSFFSTSTFIFGSKVLSVAKIDIKHYNRNKTGIRWTDFSFLWPDLTNESQIWPLIVIVHEICLKRSIRSALVSRSDAAYHMLHMFCWPFSNVIYLLIHRFNSKLETIFPESLVHNLPGFTIIMFLDNVNVYLLGSVDVFMQSCTGYLVILLKLLVKQY